MEPNTAEPLLGRRSPFKEFIPLRSPITGTITIETDGRLSASPAPGSGWQVDGNEIIFSSRTDTDYYSLTLQPPPDWTWDTSFHLQIFNDDNGGGNLCGFYSKHAKIEAFNSNNQNVQVLTMVLNLRNASGDPSPFTVFLVFPTPTQTPVPPGGHFSPQSLTGIPLGQGEIFGTVHVEQDDPDTVTGVEWDVVALGCHTTNTGGEGQIFLKPASLLGSPVNAWDLPFAVSGEGWGVASSPAFAVRLPSNPDCGVVFAGPALKAYNHLDDGDSLQSFILAVKLERETSGATHWVDDPAVVFDPPDPSGIE